MSSILNDIEDIIIALHIKQDRLKYKYQLILEKNYSFKLKKIVTNTTLIKYHTEVLEDEEGKNRRCKVVDTRVNDNLVTIYKWLGDEYRRIIGNG